MCSTQLYKLSSCISALGMGLCVAFIALVRLPSLKVSTLLLVGLLVYDVFWVSKRPTESDLEPVSITLFHNKL